MNSICFFQEIGAGDVARVGGKGANLGEMTRAGLPVPPGFCLTADAYRAFLQAAAVADEIERLLARMDPADPASVDAHAARIREVLCSREMPPELALEIKDAYARLAHECGAEAAALRVAVRSSATAEDLPTASFAGQQDTYLNIVGEAALLDHVRQCWASLWTARAVSYRIQQKFDHAQVALCVVVQAMIPSEISGVMFTANPVTGNRAEAVINASWGLGEAIVSGQVTPDTLVVNKETQTLVSRETADKARLVRYAPGGGTEEVETPPAQRTAPALSDAQALELAAIGERIEAHYGKPQDIEWAFAGGRFYLLQARPITTLRAAVTHATTVHEFNRTMFVEIFPDPLSPIFLSAICPLFHNMLDFTFETLGFTPNHALEGVSAFYSQPYFSRDYIEAAFAPLSPAVRERLVAQIVNPFGRHAEHLPVEASPAFLRMGLNLFGFMTRFPAQLPGIIARYRLEVARAAALPVAALSDTALVQAIDDLVLGAASRFLNYDFLMIALIGLTYQTLGTLLSRYLGGSTEEVRARLISGVTGNVTMETNKRMWDLAGLARQSPEVRRLLAEPDALTRLRAAPEAHTFVEALDAFLAEFGHREVRMDILYPTWSEDPAPVLSFVRAYLDADENTGPRRQQERLVRERAELAAEVDRKLDCDLQGRLFIRPLFHWVLNQAQTHTRERDTMHFELTRLFIPFRRMLAELGRRWTAQGYVTAPEDVCFLTLAELREMARAPHPVQETIRTRRAEFESHKHVAWPDLIRDGQEVFATAAPAAEAKEGELRGIAGSPGVRQGAVRIIRHPEEFSKLQRGEILVAPLTNPVWTPLFAVAGAVVTEVGGILSHGAIVAREYGIPAVMGAAHACERLHEGQYVTVDGSRGIVEWNSA